jgi:hypothetical protein
MAAGARRNPAPRKTHCTDRRPLPRDRCRPSLGMVESHPAFPGSMPGSENTRRSGPHRQSLPRITSASSEKLLWACNVPSLDDSVLDPEPTVTWKASPTARPLSDLSSWVAARPSASPLGGRSRPWLGRRRTRHMRKASDQRHRALRAGLAPGSIAPQENRRPRLTPIHGRLNQ